MFTSGMTAQSGDAESWHRLLPVVQAFILSDAKLAHWRRGLSYERTIECLALAERADVARRQRRLSGARPSPRHTLSDEILEMGTEARESFR